MRKIASRFYGVGGIIAKAFPYLDAELQQAGLDFETEEYGAIAAAQFVIYFVICTFVFFLMAIRIAPKEAIFIAPTTGGIIALLVLVQVTMYPKILLKKRVRDVERNLIFALRTMLVQIKSGVSLFDSMSMIADGDYGVLSKEFRKAIDAISTGELEEEALQKIAMNTPSTFFRRSLWQIVNGLKAGADISGLMTELVSTMTKEEGIQIRRYGSDLRLLSLMYMMIGVIVPAMGLTLLIVLSSFPQIQIGDVLFYMLLGFVVLGQFMYLGIIKSKRPNLMG